MVTRREIHGPPSQRGFILALGLLLLAAMALIGTAALSTSSFQEDLSQNTRLSQLAYYAATAGLSESIKDLTTIPPPSNTMTLANIIGYKYYRAGYYNITTHEINAIDENECIGTTSTDLYECACNGIDARSCIGFYVELKLKNYGNAPPRFGIGQYVTGYYQLVSTAQGFQGNASSVSIYIAAVYSTQYGWGGAGGGL